MRLPMHRAPGSLSRAKRGFLGARGQGCPFGISPGAFCSVPWQREEPSPSAVDAVRWESSLTSLRSSLRSSPVFIQTRDPRALTASWYSVRGDLPFPYPCKNSSPGLRSKRTFVAATLGPRGVRRGIGAFIGEQLSKGS